LSNFSRRVDRDTESRGELLTQRLAEVETHGLNLLRKEVAVEFDQAWRSFQNEWQKRLNHRYPFGDADEWAVGVQLNAGIKKLTYKMASADELHDFFFDQQKGFEAFVNRQGLLQKSHNNNTDAQFFLSDKQKAFLQTLQDWRNFLFNKKGRPKSHKVEIVLDIPQNAKDIEGASQFTQMRFNGMETAGGKMLRLRFSGRKYKHGTFVWHLNTAEQITIEAKNEETTENSALQIVGGSLAFPVMLAANGNRNDNSRLSEWALTLHMPQPAINRGGNVGNVDKFTQKIPGYKRGQIDIHLKVKWDEILPGNIMWPVN